MQDRLPDAEQDVQTLADISRRGYRIRKVFDIGASTSAWSRTVRPAIPEARIDLFEPLAEHDATYAERLRRFVEEDSDAHLHAVAVGARDGMTEMTVFPNVVGSTTLPITNRGSGKVPLRVPMRSIDSVIASGEAPAPDLVKADVQGGELEVLRGARRTLPQVQFLLLETWLTRGYGGRTPLLVELMHFLAPFGFVPYEFGGVFRDVRGYAAAVDVWFINTRLARRPQHYFSGVKDSPLAGIATRARRTLLGHRAAKAEAVSPTVVTPSGNGGALHSGHEAAGDSASHRHADTDRAIVRSIVERGYAIDSVFDIGASNSAWSTQMARELGDARFELFEPLADHVPAYRRMLNWHLQTHPQSRLHPVAIGERDGEGVLQITADAVGSTMLPVHPAVIGSRPLRVPVRSIDSIVAAGDAPRPDLIKIDIQGGELAALRGAAASLAHTSFLVIESWLVRGYGIHTPLFSELAAFLRQQGFVPFELGDAFKDDGGQTVAIDVWFINVRKSRAESWYYTGVLGAKPAERLRWTWTARLLRRFRRHAS